MSEEIFTPEDFAFACNCTATKHDEHALPCATTMCVYEANAKLRELGITEKLERLDRAMRGEPKEYIKNREAGELTDADVLRSLYWSAIEENNWQREKRAALEREIAEGQVVAAKREDGIKTGWLEIDVAKEYLGISHTAVLIRIKPIEGETKK